MNEFIKFLKNQYKNFFTKIDDTFDKFQNTAIGKFVIEKLILRAKSFYSILSTFGLILVAQISAYNNIMQWSNKVDEQLNNSDGWAYAGWFIVSFIVPSGNMAVIVALALILIVASIIRDKELSQSNTIERFIHSLEEKTKNILFEIRTNISYRNEKIELDRDEIIEHIKNELEEKQIFIISGSGGVGKTSIIKNLYVNKEGNYPFYIFKAREFKTNDFLFNHSIQDFIESNKQHTKKIIVIDSAEALLDFESDLFREFISALIQNNWKIIFTTRYSYLDDLNYHFTQILNIVPFRIDIKNLSSEYLEALSSRYKFILPQDEKLLDLIKNPFYLNEYLANYSNEEINYQDFKNKLWNQHISTPDIEKCFFEFAFKRANEGQFYVDIDCSSNSLKQLQNKGILGYEKSLGYFITHDIYEEWALEKIVNKEFKNKVDIKSFFEKIGSSLPIRRSFRSWVSEKLLLDDENIKTFIEEIIDSVDIEIFWKDEIFISILLSEYSDTFFTNFKKELLENDYELLSRISFLLRLACKEVDNSFWESLGLKNQQTKEAKYIFTKPKGTGWKSFINFIYENIETIGLAKIDLVLPILQDWNSKFQERSTTRNASLTALKYYDLINQKEHKYSYKESIKTICKVITSGSSEIKDELSTIFDEIVEQKLKNHSDNYYELSKVVLTSWDGLLISKNLPKQVLKLADLFWTKTPRKVKNDGIFPHYEREEVEDAFNLSSKYENKYFPASALQTPIYFLLKNHFSLTLDFILDLINKSVEYYAKSGWEYKEEIQIVDVFIDENITIQQYHSQSLWNIYRGNSSPVMPNLIQSIHMALEKYLLEIGKVLKTEDLEFWLLYLLQKSKSSSISAVVTSIVLANSDKAFNIARILFKTKKFIQADFHRHIQEQSLKSLYGMGYGLNWQTKIYQDERLKTCEDKHRNSNLENLFLNYQFFRTSEVSEEDAKNIQDTLWGILDNYYKQLPDEESQSEEDRIWRIALARIDRRKMNIETEKVDNGIQITFNPKLSPELQKYSQEAQNNSQNTIKYTSLYLWAVNKIENNQDYKKYTNYEENPLLALEQIKEVIAIPHDQRDFIFQDEIFPNASIVLLRDYAEMLSSEDKEICRDMILKFARLPLSENYHYQISDGVDKAIKYLPMLLIYFPELKNDIKILLLLNLFCDYQIGMSGKHFYDFAIEAINSYFNSESNSFIAIYLLLKPKYNELITSNYYGQKGVSKQDLLENFFQSNENLLENFVSNKIVEFDIGTIETNKLKNLIVVFKMISLNTTAKKEKELVRKIIEIFCVKIFNQPDEKVSYDLKLKFINRFALFVLEADKSDIQSYLQPLLNQFEPTEDIVYLLTQFILAQDEINEYDNFWHVWELFEDTIIETCKDGDKYRHIDQVIKVYLLAWGQYGAIWKDTAKEWHSLKDKDIRYFKKLTKKIGHCPSVLYSISKLLTSIASKYQNDGISWVADLLRNNSNLSNDKLEPDTVFHLENLIRQYVFIQGEQIKKDRKIKDDVLTILNFLVEKGSAVAYMLREKVL